MKKQYNIIFILIITLFLGISFSVIKHEYEKLKTTNYINEIEKLNSEIKNEIEEIENLIVYKSTPAYKNKILKQDQGMKSRKEKVMYLTEEKEYKVYTDSNYEENYQKIDIVKNEIEVDLNLKNKTNSEKWIYFIFGK